MTIYKEIMMDKFEVGEIAIVTKRGSIVNVGDEVEIVGGPFDRVERYGCFNRGYDGEEWYAIKVDGYTSHHSDGGFGKLANSLRKRRPPQELGSWEDSLWDDLGWNPTKQTVTNSNK